MESSTAAATGTLLLLKRRAEEWRKWDPNPVTAKVLQGYIDEGDEAKLSSAFPEAEANENARIEFGTAGLRAAMDIGPTKMNDLVIVQTAQGIAKYCRRTRRRHCQSSTSTRDNNDAENKIRVVIGYDHRARDEYQLSSRSFAMLSALVFRHDDMECIVLDGFVPTPLLAYSTYHLGATVGIMVTASHNPKQDAGYKVYWNDAATAAATTTTAAACQIRPPMDDAIAACIQENLEPWIDYGALLQERKEKYSKDDDVMLGLSDPQITATMRASYMNAIRTSGLVVPSSPSSSPSSQATPTPNDVNDDKNNFPKFCYTAMHGVGHDFCVQVFDEVFQLPPFYSVPQQQEPDSHFTTVVFPNPEEKGALDLAMAHAEQNGCHIILANDPDADRLAVAEYNDASKKWTVFTGDQIGALLGSWMWEIMGKNSDKPVAMCASTVSSRLLAEMARVEGFHFEDTLTGFKWIGSRAAALDASGEYRSIFCYEEAIGFCCGNVVFDKDGLSAAGVFAQLARHVYREQNATLADHLQQLYDKYGEFVSHNGYYFYGDDPAVVTKIFASIRNDGSYVSSVGPYRVSSIRDLGDPGYDSATADGRPTLPILPASSPMITIAFENGCVVQFRASGTEPKFKYYIELRGAPGVARAVVQDELSAMSSLILRELLRPEENGLSATR